MKNIKRIPVKKVPFYSNGKVIFEYSIVCAGYYEDKEWKHYLYVVTINGVHFTFSTGIKVTRLSIHDVLCSITHDLEIAEMPYTEAEKELGELLEYGVYLEFQLLREKCYKAKIYDFLIKNKEKILNKQWEEIA